MITYNLCIPIPALGQTFLCKCKFVQGKDLCTSCWNNNYNLACISHVLDCWLKFNEHIHDIVPPYECSLTNVQGGVRGVKSKSKGYFRQIWLCPRGKALPIIMVSRGMFQPFKEFFFYKLSYSKCWKLCQWGTNPAFIKYPEGL